MPSSRILLVEDDATQRRMVADILRGAGYTVAVAASVDEGLTAFAEGRQHDLVLSDWKIGSDGDGLELMRRLRERAPDVAFLLTTAYGTIAHAVAAVQQGVDDYLPKPFERAALLLAVERTLKSRRLADENRRLSEQLGERQALLDLLGKAPAMQQVYRQLERVAATDATVLFGGESGTGKELAARSLHQLSPRAHGPFVAVNCAAVPAELLESEFFGCRRGAFTGAHQDRTGRFADAAGGTLFLDEIGELPVALQPKLLRALQERRITPVGDSREIPVDVRIAAATNRDLRAEIAAGRFREDLYYRLAVVDIELPPLRARREDLPLLIEHFVERSARAHGTAAPTVPAALRRRLLDHPWPGNVRELANTIERLVILAQDGSARAEDLPPGFAPAPGAASVGAQPFVLPPTGVQWEAVESSLLAQALALANGNRKRAAELLGMPYKAFLYRVEKFGIDGE
jgi:two-component system NtrC family response regulator